MPYRGARRVHVAVRRRARLEVDVVGCLFLYVQGIHFIVAAWHHADLQQHNSPNSKFLIKLKEIFCVKFSFYSFFSFMPNLNSCYNLTKKVFGQVCVCNQSSWRVTQFAYSQICRRYRRQCARQSAHCNVCIMETRPKQRSANLVTEFGNLTKLAFLLEPELNGSEGSITFYHFSA